MPSLNLRSRLLGYFQRRATSKVWRRPFLINSQRLVFRAWFSDPIHAFLSRRTPLEGIEEDKVKF